MCGQGATFVNQYIVIKTLGSGAYGKVKLALDSKDHKLYAIKLINKVSELLVIALLPAGGMELAPGT